MSNSIQWQSQQNLVIGVLGEVSPMSPVVLVGVNSANSAWNLDVNSGIIALASDPSLVLTINGNVDVNFTPLCVAPLESNPVNQTWNWLETRSLILAAGNRNFCIDNLGGLPNVGNPVQNFSDRGGRPESAMGHRLKIGPTG